GIEGASAGIKLAKKAGAKTQAWAKTRAGSAGRRLATAGAAGHPESKSYLERLSETKFGKAVGRIPLVGRGVTGISGIAERSKQTMRKQSEEAQKKYKDRSDASLEARSKQLHTMKGLASVTERAAVDRELARRGKLTKAQQATAVADARRTGTGEALLAHIPTLAMDLQAKRT
ncbi:MAG: hypothetical protein AAB601_00900, partial [Patescibacteria group bacterium]